MGTGEFNTGAGGGNPVMDKEKARKYGVSCNFSTFQVPSSVAISTIRANIYVLFIAPLRRSFSTSFAVF